MALIGQIRKNSWLLVILIGLALAAFIIMDMTSSGSSGMSSQFTVAEVNGDKLDWREFQNAENVLYQNSGGDIFSQREYLWNFFLEKALVESETEEIGLGVSSAELRELQFGSNLSPVIIQRFQDPNTRQINRTLLNEYRQQIESNQITADRRQFWAFQEKEIIKDRLQTKINSIVGNGIYTPTWMAEKAQETQSQQMTIDLLKIPFAEVDDSEVEVTDAEISSYLKAHEKEYAQREETRSINYVSFEVYPTPQDSADIRMRLKEKASLFANAENDTLFVQNNFGIMDGAYAKAEELSLFLADTAFNVEMGTVLGPYQDQGQYKIAKILDKIVLADSVKSRHILRRVTTQEEYNAEIVRIDSIKTAIENGSLTFAAAATKYGTDATASKGGDLGFAALNAMVKPYNDYIFYNGELNELGIVFSQFGIHLVEITDKKFDSNIEAVKVAYIFEDIIPSSETQDKMYEDAITFVADNRDMETLRQTANKNPNIELIPSRPLEKNDYSIANLGGTSTSRDIVRWVFAPDSRVGDVSPEVYIYKHPTLFYNQRLVIAGLSSINDGALPGVESARVQIEPLVRNEKKAEILKSRMEGKSMAQVASDMQLDIQNDVSITFNQNFIPGAGNEPKVVGEAFALSPGESSGPIVGQGGVYLVTLKSKTDPTPMTNLALFKRSQKIGKVNQLGVNLWNSLKDEAKIEDNRFTFY